MSETIVAPQQANVMLTEGLADSPDIRTSTAQSGLESIDEIPQYDDPYKKAVEYMEKHQILHVFREITERMVFNRPDDPLLFMQNEVENLISDREKRVAERLAKSKEKSN